jgi:hypothetical protein
LDQRRVTPTTASAGSSLSGEGDQAREFLGIDTGPTDESAVDIGHGDQFSMAGAAVRT